VDPIRMADEILASVTTDRTGESALTVVTKAEV